LIFQANSRQTSLLGADQLIAWR